MDLLLEILLFPIGDLVWAFIDGIGSAFKRNEPRPRAVRAVSTGSCAYCRRRGGGFVTCSACRAPHHGDCAKVNGRCAVYGCRARTFRVPPA